MPGQRFLSLLLLSVVFAVGSASPIEAQAKDGGFFGALKNLFSPSDRIVGPAATPGSEPAPLTEFTASVVKIDRQNVRVLDILREIAKQTGNRVTVSGKMRILTDKIPDPPFKP